MLEPAVSMNSTNSPAIRYKSCFYNFDSNDLLGDLKVTYGSTKISMAILPPSITELVTKYSL